MIEYTEICLGKIFSQTKDREKFTDDALLYQEILSFSLWGIDHLSFTFIGRDISKWLKKNHHSFEKRSVDSLKQLVDRKIKKLMELQLIHEIGTRPIRTGTGQTSVYAFDSMGYFLGWLIESFSSDPIRKIKAVDKIFNFLYLMLDTNVSSSMSIFLKALIKKMKVSGLFMHLVDYMIELLKSSNSIKDISDLINQTLLFRHVELNLVNKYNELWEKTLNELEPQMRQLVMFRLKLLYEQRVKERALHPTEFEKVRFSARDRFDKIVLECKCHNLSCQCIGYESIDFMEYMIRLRHHIKGVPSLVRDCPLCNKKGSLHVTDL
jgi:hypothetical protein